MTVVAGNILKLKSKNSDPVEYSLPIGVELVGLNSLIGKTIKLTFEGQINCIETGKKIKKSYAQGFSYPAFISLAKCDMCIMKPETCHFDKGTCREPEWAEKNCFVPHIVYLANSSGLKVGITRESQVPTRWIDQGAHEAVELFRVQDRKTSGLIEVMVKEYMGDKTNWRKMLQNLAPEIDLIAKRDEIQALLADRMGEFDIEIRNEELHEINFPVIEYPTKVKSIGFDKVPEIEGTLMGIKGQYLIFDHAVLNIRKHQGYHITLEY